ERKRSSCLSMSCQQPYQEKALVVNENQKSKAINILDTWLTTAADVCHLDRPRRSEATEGEWRDPENAYTTMLIQGMSTRTLSLTPSVLARVVPTAWREHLVSLWQRTHPRDLSTPLRSPSTSSGSLRVGRDDRH